MASVEKVPMLAEGYEKLTAQLAALKAERPLIVDAIEEARAHGDLSENAEYHAAKERQGQVEATIGDLEDKLSAPALASDYLQCVPFARDESGVQLFGAAKSWWHQADGTYDRGNEPRKGAVLAFASSRSMPSGHVAVVSKVLNAREIMIDHANWSPIGNRRGQIERNVRVMDVSPNNDWTMVRVWYAPIGDLGLRANPVHGFIYPSNDGHNARPTRQRQIQPEAPRWAQNGWKPGNGLENIVATLR